MAFASYLRDFFTRGHSECSRRSSIAITRAQMARFAGKMRSSIAFTTCWSKSKPLVRMSPPMYSKRHAIRFRAPTADGEPKSKSTTSPRLPTAGPQSKQIICRSDRVSIGAPTLRGYSRGPSIPDDRRFRTGAERSASDNATRKAIYCPRVPPPSRPRLSVNRRGGRFG
jgi:hypothetical protein